MNTSTHQKEILLVTNAGFFSQHWVKRNESEADKRFTQKEKLIDACWNGLAPQMLPECFNNSTDNELALWEVTDTVAFIDLDFWDGEAPSENEFSINPYIFMEVKDYN
ncbi:hypothetical protein [Ferruginibacter sp. SUN106]|uniref:hypothetical protein n=1 Tax=Ferruginibacter sp. SUN106 TaxID=2978348 RepID=UPI003D35B4B7